MLKPSNLSKTLSKHSFQCTQCFPTKSVFSLVLTFEKLIMCQHQDLTSLIYVNSPEPVYISVSEDLKYVQHVAKLQRMNDTFFWSLVQQKGYPPTARKLLSMTQNDSGNKEWPNYFLFCPTQSCVQ